MSKASRWLVIEDGLTWQAKKTTYTRLRPIMLSGAFRGFLEWSTHHPYVNGALLQSSSSFNFMMAIGGLYQQGYLSVEMAGLNDKLRGRHCDMTYIMSLQALRRDLELHEQRLSDATMGKCLLLAFQTRMFDVNDDRPDGLIHTRGLCALVKARDAMNVKTDRALQLFRACRIVVLYASLYHGEPAPFSMPLWCHGMCHQPSYSAIDNLTDILHATCDFGWRMQANQDESSMVHTMNGIKGCISSLDQWYRTVRHRCGWEIIEQNIANSRCPFSSFLTFNNPLAAEAYSIFYTILLIFSRIKNSTPGCWPHDSKLSECLPHLDTTALAIDIGRMTPYFIAGGALGYYVIEYPVRFAMRCFVTADTRQNRLWLEAVMNRAKLSPLDEIQFCMETPHLGP